VSLRLVGWAALALVVVFGAGWIVGSSGRSAAEEARRAAEERADFAAARARIFQGRVSLFLVNFGDASRRFEEARALVEQAQTRLREMGEAERAGRLEIVVTNLQEAQRLAAALDASAQNAADQAVQALDAAATSRASQ
jgi:hypothetical protein